jgi:hypothetical protein
MLTVNKKVCAMVLGLMIMFAAVMPASAQSRYRGRDRGLSTKEKIGIVAGGAAVGAIIGGLLGGKKGAVLGGVAGGGAGGGYVYYKHRQEDDRYERYGYSRYRGYRGERYYRSRR